MEEKRYCVYIHTTPSNKVYIGLTCKKPKRRWANGYGYRNQQYFFRAIEKYGWENMHHIIVKENISKEEAIELEKMLIKTFESTNPQKGYNVSLGGDISENRLGVKHTEETKQKISKYLTGRKMSEEARRKMSESRKGEKNWNYGKKFSEEQRRKMALAHLGQIPHNAKKVQCVETKEIFPSIAQAQREKSVNNIWLACDKPDRTAGGFHWVFYKESEV